MASSSPSAALAATNDDHKEEDAPSVVNKPSPQLLDHLRQYISTLRPISGCSMQPLYLHNSCYIPKPALLGALLTPHLFRPEPSDVLLATTPKSGTTWLKALLFATVHRRAVPCSQDGHPLTCHSPHQLVPGVEYFVNSAADHLAPTSAHYQVFNTHLPVHLLPEESFKCRVIYLCREPKDCFVSLMCFVNKLRAETGQELLPLEAGFEAFCDGASMMGPYWDHVIGYWERREEVLFLKYEAMMEDPVGNLRRIADFIGRPFTEEEDGEGVAEGIVRFCEFESLSGLEVNRSGVMRMPTGWTRENNAFFRKAKIGDWVNHISPEMGRRLDEITEAKFRGTGLSFGKGGVLGGEEGK